MKLPRFLCLALCVVCSFMAWTAAVAHAQQPLRAKAAPVARPTAPANTPYLAPPPVTPELWIYSQEQRRYDDPAQAVRRKAEARTAARMERIEAMKWFGFSNARPQASVTPTMGSYSPAWIGNGYDPYDWVGVSWPTAAIRVESLEYNLRR